MDRERLHALFFRKKRKISIALVLVLIFGSFPAKVEEAAKVKAADSKYGINNPRTDSNGLTTWDCVYFGNYRQNDTNGDGIANREDDKQPIKWRVLSVNGDDAFLLADQNLDYKEYGVTMLEEDANLIDHDYEMTTWESCTLRGWLNEDFYNDAFSVAEQAAVQTTEVVNKDNYGYGTEGGDNTHDKIYLLSFDEVINPSYGFPSDVEDSATRATTNTEYANQICKVGGPNKGREYQWWLRSPGAEPARVAYITKAGSVFAYGYWAYYVKLYAVRPVLHLNLSSGLWSKAGTVSATGGPTEARAALYKPFSTPSPTPTASPGKKQTTTVTTKPTGASTAAVLPEVKFTRVNREVQEMKKTQSVSLTWQKISGAKGYQIQYALNEKFTKKKKSKLIKKTKITIKKLNKKQHYYFRVRAYKTSGKKKKYGKWSKVIRSA